MESDFNGLELPLLAATHAYLGEPERAAEVLARQLRLGRVNPWWKGALDLASPGASETEVFRSFVEEHEAEAQRLRKAYGPRS